MNIAETLRISTFGCCSVGQKVEVLPELMKGASFCVHTSIFRLQQLTLWVAPRSIMKSCLVTDQR